MFELPENAAMRALGPKAPAGEVKGHRNESEDHPCHRCPLGALAAALRNANKIMVTAGYTAPHGVPLIWDKDGHVYVYHAYGNADTWHTYGGGKPAAYCGC